MTDSDKIHRYFIVILFILLIASGSAFLLARSSTTGDTERTIVLEEHMRLLEENSSSRFQTMEDQLQQLSNQAAESARALQDLKQQIVTRQPSQEEILTSAVANATPSVVSIVVSKDVPQLVVEYVNPFGDDPFYRDFGFRIPVYRQKGTVEQKVGAGTGFIVSRDGHIITNRHVAADTDAHYTVLLWSGAQKSATVVYRDPAHDIAILKIEGAYTPLRLGNSNAVRLGQSVVAIGNALGEFNNSVSTGIVSGLNRTIEASDGKETERIEGVIQTDAAINRGNSGGPLLDLSGNAIGVNVATVLGSNNISFAIPINVAKSILEKAL